MHPVHALRQLSDMHKPRSIKQSTTNVPRPILIVVSRCLFLKAHMPWLMLHVVGQCWCHLADAHTPRHMHARDRWCYLLLANVTFPKFKCLGWCCLTLFDANVGQPMHKCHNECVQDLLMCCDWPTSTNWCVIPHILRELVLCICRLKISLWYSYGLGFLFDWWE